MFEKILVCPDGSSAAERVLSAVGAEIAAMHTKVILLQVIQIPQSNITLNLSGSTAIPEVTKRELERNINEEKHANDYPEEKAKVLQAQKIEVGNVVLTGHTGEIIVNYAHNNSCSLIAMATHGYGGLRRLGAGWYSRLCGASCHCVSADGTVDV